MRPVCPQCGRVVFYDPKVAAVCVIARDGQVLMIRRGTDLGYGLWSLPGGFVDRGEVVEEAAAREAWEETGLEVTIDGLLGLFSLPRRSRDRRSLHRRGNRWHPGAGSGGVGNRILLAGRPPRTRLQPRHRDPRPLEINSLGASGTQSKSPLAEGEG